jgi:type II secretory ATPase GspE/PulE/Tfp pilus assembly ATPase PilB-like protein
VYEPPEYMAETLKRWYGTDGVRLFKGKGCQKCNHMGYSGRTVIGELLVMDDQLRTAVVSKAGTKDLNKIARTGGMIPLFTNGLRKIRDGQTTTDEVLRAIGAEAYGS